MAVFAIPKPSYLDGCLQIKGKGDRRRWMSTDGRRLYEWDSQHGEIEVYNTRGKHLGVKNAQGKMIKKPVKGRTIDV